MPVKFRENPRNPAFFGSQPSNRGSNPRSATILSWGALNGPAPQTPGAAAGVNPAFAWFCDRRRLCMGSTREGASESGLRHLGGGPQAGYGVRCFAPHTPRRFGRSESGLRWGPGRFGARARIRFALAAGLTPEFFVGRGAFRGSLPLRHAFAVWCAPLGAPRLSSGNDPGLHPRRPSGGGSPPVSGQ